MLSNIFSKTLFQKRWTLLFWSLGVTVMAWLTLAFYESFTQSGGFEEVIKSLPPQMQALVGNIESLKTVGGFVDSQIFQLRIPLLTIIMAIALFLSVTASEEEDGVLQTTLAQPISRSTLLVQKYAASALMLLVACSASLLGLWLGLQSISDTHPFELFVAGVFNCWLLTMAYGSFAFLLGAATGRRGLSAGIASLFALGSFFLATLAESVASLEPLGKLTFFDLYSSPETIVNGLNWTNVSILAASSVLMLGLSVWLFGRRDLKN